MGQSLGQKNDKKMRGTVWSRSKGANRTYFEGMKRGRTALSLRWVIDSGKRCQVVEGVNLQLGSEEWLIRRHLQENGNHI